MQEFVRRTGRSLPSARQGGQRPPASLTSAATAANLRDGSGLPQYFSVNCSNIIRAGSRSFTTPSADRRAGARFRQWPNPVPGDDGCYSPITIVDEHNLIVYRVEFRSGVPAPLGAVSP